MMVLQATTITGQEQTSKDRTGEDTPVRPALLLAEQGIGFGFRLFAHGRLLVPATAEQPSLVGLCYAEVRDEFVTGEGVRVPERPRAIRSAGPLEEASPPQPFVCGERGPSPPVIHVRCSSAGRSAFRGRGAQPATASTTAIIPASSWSLMWQWKTVRPSKSSKGMRTVVSPPADTRTTSR